MSNKFTPEIRNEVNSLKTLAIFIVQFVFYFPKKERNYHKFFARALFYVTQSHMGFEYIDKTVNLQYEYP